MYVWLVHYRYLLAWHVYYSRLFSILVHLHGKTVPLRILKALLCKWVLRVWNVINLQTSV